MQDKWKQAFGLKYINEEIKPQIPQDISKQIGKEIKFKLGSLFKIVARHRERYIPQIKETFENPEAVFVDSDGLLIFAKRINNKQYFTSVNADKGEYFVSISLAPKTNNNLENKLKNAKEVYRYPNPESNSPQRAFTGETSPANNSKADSTTNPLKLQTNGVKKYAELNKEFKEAIAPILNKDITNKQTGIVARISSTGSNKIKSKVAIDKSLDNGFTKEEHFEAGKNIKELFEVSKYLSSEEAKNKSSDIKAVHRYATDINLDDKPARVLLTLKESVENGNRIYSLELQELTPLSKANAHTKHSQQGQSYLSKFGDMGSPTAIEKIDKANSTTNPLKLQTNQHIGSGILGGMINGIEEDENGNLTFNPSKFLSGFGIGIGGSLGLQKSFKYLKENKEAKEKVINEIANTLKLGWENLENKYPHFAQILQPRYIIKNERGRSIQAKSLLNKMEKVNLEEAKKEAIKYLENIKGEALPKNLSEKGFLEKGLKKVINKENFLKHLKSSEDSKTRLDFLNLVEPTLEKWDLKLDLEQGKKEYIKAFRKENDKSLFYVLVTKQDDKLLITGIPKSKLKSIKSDISKALNIETSPTATPSTR